jgi:hypothetical protein
MAHKNFQHIPIPLEKERERNVHESATLWLVYRISSCDFQLVILNNEIPEGSQTNEIRGSPDNDYSDYALV